MKSSLLGKIGVRMVDKTTWVMIIQNINHLRRNLKNKTGV